eukprot:CAMPEP_0183295652 /NCGR_PEP_ID=MMETSP0160_2-20130417/3535_1 /TAXON_ID=2839 ORGANISM="Odontella Sinensis, Strain Grunow 1884" /NCGR_SAMPLE_ID=MMETSP0160_2 /ASSEMBLY_ACC=CAM_ASM_000250 /LENGTH=104 /DNA_ID=CAMNT_0025457171 /DNA_START=268 /DNA_END=582 /DNA_ORIENTATION=+
MHIRSLKSNCRDSNNSPDNCSQVKIIGVEIEESASDLEDLPFTGDIALMMGNEGQGMNHKQMAMCDSFIKISQYGVGTASLNVNVAASIVMHRFHHWARGDAVA